MEKIVSESVKEFRERKRLNEANFLNKAFGAIKNFFKKVGKFFFFQTGEGQAEPVILPINIGIMSKNNQLPDYISYIASQEDIDLEPNLKSENDQKLIAKYKAMEKNAKVNEALVPLKHPNTNMENIGREDLYRLVRIALKNPKAPPLMIWGAPGIGKTQIVEELVKAKGAGRLVDVQTSKMAPDDWALPYVMTQAAGQIFDIGVKQSLPDQNKKEVIQRPIAIDIPKSWLPVYIPTGDPEIDKQLDEALGKGVLFLDELSRANEAVQNTCLKLVNQRIIGDAKIGSKWVVISASNRSVDDPDTLPSWSSALGNRFQNYNYVPNFEEWKEWAVGKVDTRILDFLDFNQELFYTLDDEKTMDSAFASPRSWAAASKAIESLAKDAEEEGYRVTAQKIEQTVAGSVGKDVALELGKFFRIMETFSKKDVRGVFTDPDKAPLPRKVGDGYDLAEGAAFLSLLVSSSKGTILPPEEFSNYCKYLVKLDNASLATRGLKSMVSAHTPYIDEGLGEIEGKDEYKEGVDIFLEKYKDVF